jgi:hypothetical protein
MASSSSRIGMAVALAAVLLWAIPAGGQEREVGVTSAANPRATGTPPISAAHELEIGRDVVHEERVQTDPAGRAHMLFLDGSALTVGADSDVVLDTFVYDPDTKTGELAFAATKGLFRLVGGRISKSSPVLFKTPSGTIGVRDGIVIVQVYADGRVVVTFLFGTSVTVSNEQGSVTIKRPGFAVEIAGPGMAPGAPFLPSADYLATALAGLEAVAGTGGDTRDLARAPRVEVISTNVVAVGSDLDPSEFGVDEESCEEDECLIVPPTSKLLVLANQGLAQSTSSVILSVGNVTVTEGGTFNAIVTLSAALPVDLVLTFATTSGSAIKGGGGVAQNDFGTTGTATIPAGALSTVIPLTTIDDGVFEGTETFFVDVSSVLGLTTLAGRGLVTLIDDEPQPTLGIADLTFTEATAGTATAGGGGPGGKDFVATSGTVTIPAGETTATIAVTVNGDTVAIEGAETFTVDLSAATGPVTIADAQSLATITNNLTGAVTYQGAGKRDLDATPGTDDNSAADNLGFTQALTSGGNFQATTAAGGIYFLPLPTAGFTLALTGGVTPFGTVSGSGFLSATSEFLFYELDAAGNKQFIFGGVPTAITPTTGILRYALKSDFALGSDIPFIPNAVGGSLSPTVTTHVFVDYDTSGGGTQRPFGGGVVFINGSGATQQSAASIFAGEVLSDGAGKPFVQGQMRGTSRVTGGTFGLGRAHFFESDVASADAGDGSDFFGSGPDHFVLEASTVSAADALLGRTGVEEKVGNIVNTGIFPNVVAIDDPPVLGTLTAPTRTLNGFVGGIVQETTGATLNATRAITASGNAVTITASAALNTVDASFAFNANDTYALTLGDNATTGKSFLIDDNTFGAIERTASLTDGGGPVALTQTNADMITDFALDHTGLLPGGVAFCTCVFLEWGFWGADYLLATGDRREIDMATWVAGELAAASQLTITQAATYNGHVIAAVNNNGSRYTAVGGLSVGINFNVGGAYFVNTASITDFDTTNLAFNFIATGSGFTTANYNSATAGFDLRGTHPASGGDTIQATFTGSLFGTGTPPDETGGTIQFNQVTGPAYSASGTYAAKR